MDTSKIIKGVVNSGRYTVTAPIVKENYGIYLQIEGVELPETYQVDFSNDEHHGTSVTMIGNADGVKIPRQFIDTGKDVFAFLYWVGEDYGKTVYKFRIPNKVRPDRTNEEPTPEEQSVIDQAINALNEAVEKTAEDVESADQSAQSAKEDADRAEQAKEDASTFAQRSANSAQASADYSASAQTSATASAQSASEAETARQATTSLVAEAQGYANASEQSATASANSAEQAESAKGVAQSYAQDAQTSATYASVSESTANAKAQEASGYAQTASTKASESAQSATNAQGYAQTAEQAKTDAQTAQGLAESARDTAVQAKTDAESARDDAESARDEAQQAVASIADALDDKAPIITDTASGSIASFSDGADNLPLKSLVVNIDPVQDLSQGDPSPDNVCPIEGWTGAQVTRTGKNLLDTTNAVNGKINADGSVDANPADPRKVTKMLSVKPNTAYYFWNVVSASEGRSGYWYDSSGNGIGLIVVGGVNASSGTVTSPSNAAYCRVNYFATNENICMMSLGTAQPTSYEPYTGNTYSISWETEAGTVYGGTLDVVSGELMVDRTYIIFDGSEDETWYTYSNTGYRVPKTNIGLSGNGICNIATTVSSASSYGVMFSASNNYIYFFKSVSGWGVATLTDLRAWLATNNVEVCYELATPITYHLTPQEVRTLLGQNNVFADTGDSTVEYYADTKRYIDKRIAELG